jgi:hypothetical protein
MQAKSTYIAFSLLLTCCVAFSLASCQNSSWHLAASKKGGTVELCLSNGDECPQAGGVSPSSISVYRWDNMHDNELVWDAEPKNPIAAGNISGVVTYRRVPSGSRATRLDRNLVRASRLTRARLQSGKKRARCPSVFV